MQTQGVEAPPPLTEPPKENGAQIPTMSAGQGEMALRTDLVAKAMSDAVARSYKPPLFDVAALAATLAKATAVTVAIKVRLLSHPPREQRRDGLESLSCPNKPVQAKEFANQVESRPEGDSDRSGRIG